MVHARYSPLPGALLLVALCTLASCHLALPFDVVSTDQSPVSDAAADSAADAAADSAVDSATDSAPRLTFGQASPVTEINTSGNEDDPTLTGDMLEIYFERHGDIWHATRAATSELWSRPARVTALSSQQEDGTPDLAADGLTIFFASRRPGVDVKGGIEIYVATRPSRDASWSLPALVPALNSPDEDLCAAPSADLLTVALDSTRAGGVGMRDLYFSTRAGLKQPWGVPAVLVGVNSAADDECPWIDATGALVLFASDRNANEAGNNNIWFAARDPHADFSAPALIPGINSAGADGDPWLSPDRKTIYFYSNRNGSGDIFVARRAP